ncbi:hypothetical protein BJ875DRAFT_448516 [Amylocarpus encephaloides]|uniref:RING-type domain-containing protein n=1 Tax=Amylocarpus encephaloides TaxID=45428 RepID=A0A9P7YUK6_9HELO|nr:hypothetical protein BJ875DRAFT_448516 [Amylocarpus encephaloides]
METGPENRGLDLEKELTCSICTEVLYQPITLLDCLHTFCASCAKEWFSFQLNSSRNNPNPGTTPFTCPSCRDPIRSTRHDAKVTTLLEMFLAANPAKARTRQEMIDLEDKYRPGDIILPKIEAKEKSSRERRADDEDARLLEEVRGLSLREVGVEEGSSERRERRRRDGERLRPDGTRPSREQSRDSRASRSGDDRERRRRRETDSGRRRRDDAALRPETEHVEERRRPRSNDEARRRHEETSRTAASQLEHQSSLRSLISSSDVDAREMEEEILRQIREEGLLDGIDLENIDVGQEDQISERIAEAYRKRQADKAREERERRRADGHRRQHSRSAPESRETSADDRSTRRRTHSRAVSAASAVSTVSALSQSDEPNRPPPAISAFQSGHLEVHSSDEGRRRRRTTSGSRSSTDPVPVAETQARPAARSQTDLSSRPQSAETNLHRPSVTMSSGSATEPNNRHSVELAGSEPTPRDQRSTNSSPRMGMSARMEDSSMTLSPLSQNNWSPAHDTLTGAPFTGSTLLATSVDQALMPSPLSPNQSPNHSPSASLSLSDRATAFQSAARPNSSNGETHERKRSTLYPEPSITCARCSKSHIEYSLHYNCAACHGGNYNICLTCFRGGSGCLHWFGFGYSAWTKWEAWANDQNLSDAEKPHMLIASRYLPPPTVPGGAPGRKTLTKSNPLERLQSGVFCACCLEWANECYWRCETCNEGDWGFCNTCVNQGKCCTHSLLPLTFQALEPDKGDNTPPGQALPASASILTGPGVQDIGRFKPLKFTTQCDICHYGIPPEDERYHCLQCTSNVPGTNTKPGDYDICMACYPKLSTSRRISAENGTKGWIRCLQGHRMIIIGFKNTHGGLRRYIAEEMVGGWSLKIKPFVPPPTASSLPSSDLQTWSWPSPLSKDYYKLVTVNPMNTPPPHIDGVDQEEHFPPSGGSGMRCLARWSWWPAEDVSDELAFPKGAEVREARDVNGEWWFGTYMGKCGLFPGGYARILEGGR